MPPKKRLSEEKIALLREWIKNGADDPRPSTNHAAARPSTQDASWKAEFQNRLDWWSLKPVQKALAPATSASPEIPVDRFVQEKLHAAGLRPAPRAEAGVLLRRASLVLTGLPPAPAEVNVTFAGGAAETAYFSFLERLLQSQHFGEHFARHWLDVVRYTDTYGYEWDNPAKGSWEYRDYVIRAFNDDLGFERFLK